MSEGIGNQQQGALGALCQLIIDELKNLYARGNGISTFTLFDGLARKPQMQNLLGVRGCLEELKNAYARILCELVHQSGKDFQERISVVLAKVNESKSFAEIDRLRKDIIDIVQDYTLAVLEDKRAYSGLIVEIGTQLSELESRCFGLFEDTSQTHQANNAFNFMMDSQVNDLQDAADTSQNLMEIRERVKSKLDTIRDALEKKKTEDRFRERRFEITIDKLQNDLKGMRERVVRTQAKKKHLEQEVLIDPLTGIANRRGLEKHLRKQMKRYKRHDTVFSLILFDIDEFKKVNDTYGHWVGDKCITTIVERISKILRETDFIARFGGDEFIICLPDTDRTAAQNVARKLSSAVSNTRIIYQETEINLSISIGLTQVEANDYGPESIFTRADTALYNAKNQGRNLVVVA